MRDAINKTSCCQEMGGDGASRLEMLEKMASGLYNIIILFLPLFLVFFYTPPNHVKNVG